MNKAYRLPSQILVTCCVFIAHEHDEYNLDCSKRPLRHDIHNTKYLISKAQCIFIFLYMEGRCCCLRPGDDSSHKKGKNKIRFFFFFWFNDIVTKPVSNVGHHWYCTHVAMLQTSA